MVGEDRSWAVLRDLEAKRLSLMARVTNIKTEIIASTRTKVELTKKYNDIIPKKARAMYRSTISVFFLER